MSKKYQVFISSTYEDLEGERDQVIKAVLEMGHIPVGMEMFSAGDEQQWNLIKRQIEESDYYIVVVAHRYGSKDGEISYTEKEYDYAVENRIPVLGFVLEDSADWKPEFIDKEVESVQKLEAFKDKVKSKIVSFWTSSDDLYGKCSIALMKAITSYPRIGWVRSNETVNPDIVNEVTRLSRENSTLRQELEASKIKLEASAETAEEKVIDILNRNERSVFVWIRSENEWGQPIKTTLLALFEIMGKELLGEASNESLGSIIGFEYTGSTDLHRNHPVPTNFLREWITDLVALGLMQPSTKKHSVHDGNEYWMLTKLGKKVHSNLRLLRLKRGLESDETPEQQA